MHGSTPHVHLGCEHRKPRRGEGAPPFPAPKGWTARVEVIDAQHEEDGGPCGMAEPQSEGVPCFCFRLSNGSKNSMDWWDYGFRFTWFLWMSIIFLIQWNFFVWAYNFGYYSRSWWDNITKMGETHTNMWHNHLGKRKNISHFPILRGYWAPTYFLLFHDKHLIFGINLLCTLSLML